MRITAEEYRQTQIILEEYIELLYNEKLRIRRFIDGIEDMATWSVGMTKEQVKERVLKLLDRSPNTSENDEEPFVSTEADAEAINVEEIEKDAVDAAEINQDETEIKDESEKQVTVKELTE